MRSLAFILYLISACGAAAQTNCGPYEAISERLSGKYGEQVHGRGLNAEGNLLEIWVSPVSGTYTALFRNPSGLACIVGAGQYWTDVEFAEVAKGEDM